jgi:hypothetical protein
MSDKPEELGRLIDNEPAFENFLAGAGRGF